MAGTEGASFAFFSPDGGEVGFLTGDRLKKLGLFEGGLTTLTSVATPTGATWLEDGSIYVFEDVGQSLTRVASKGQGRTEIVRSIDTRPNRRLFTQVLPGGRAALVTVTGRSESVDYANVRLFMLDTLTDTPILSRAYGATYLPSGHLRFARAGALFVVPFDLSRLTVRGEEVRVVSGVATESLFGAVHAASADNGTLVYVAGADLARGRIAWVNRRGERGAVEMPDAVYGVFDLSPDGHRIATGVHDIEDHVWLWDDRTGVGQVFANRAYKPQFDARSEAVAFLVRADDGEHLVMRNGSGGEPRDLLIPDAAPTSWRDGGRLSVDAPGAVGVITAGSGAQPQWIRKDAWGSELSMDGRYLAYGSDERGRWEVWVHEVDGSFRRQVSTDGGVEPIWCTACDELFYRNGSRIFSARITARHPPEFGPPTLAFVAEEFVDTAGKSFDISPDGQRAYYVRRTTIPNRTKIHVVHNWFEELRRLAPAK